MSEEKKVTIYSNPKIDHLFGFLGGEPAPTKKDSFKPLMGLTTTTKDGEILKNIYEKKPSNKKVKIFQAKVSELANSAIEKIIKQPSEVEVVLSFSLTPDRYKSVDLDNLAKTVLDGLTGIAFEDDSQVSSLICNKFIHENKQNSLLIGVTELTEEQGGFVEDIKLFRLSKNGDYS